jgi:hypothetical protein
VQGARRGLAWLIALALAGLLATITAAPSSAQPDGVPESAAGSSAVEETVDGFEVMAREIAPHIGVSEADVVEALKLQEASTPIVEYYEAQAGASFAGSWIEHFPDFELTIFTTDETLRQTIEPAVPTRFVRVDHSLDELETQLESVLAWSSNRGVLIGGYVDVPTNSIVVTVTPDAASAVVIERSDADAVIRINDPETLEEATLPIDVSARREVQPRDSAAANIHGGHRTRKSSGGPSCTTGFTVKNSAGTRGVLTAGHCGNTSRAYFATQSGSVFSMSDALDETENANGRDWQWHTVPGHTPINQIYTGYNGFVTITATKSQSSMGGALICHMGIGSGYSCGYVASVSHAPGGDYATEVCSGTCNNECVRVRQLCFQGCAPLYSNGGDSGGPWHSGGTAYGILSGDNCDTFAPWSCTGNQGTFFQGIRKVTNKVTPLTS